MGSFVRNGEMIAAIKIRAIILKPVRVGNAVMINRNQVFAVLAMYVDFHQHRRLGILINNPEHNRNGLFLNRDHTTVCLIDAIVMR